MPFEFENDDISDVVIVDDELDKIDSDKNDEIENVQIYQGQCNGIHDDEVEGIILIHDDVDDEVYDDVLEDYDDHDEMLHIIDDDEVVRDILVIVIVLESLHDECDVNE